MPRKSSSCPHVTTVGNNSWEDVEKIKHVSNVETFHSYLNIFDRRQDKTNIMGSARVLCKSIIMFTIYISQEKVKCETCSAVGPNLWLCLHSDCLYVGCGESSEDHSSCHTEVRERYIKSVENPIIE